MVADPAPTLTKTALGKRLKLPAGVDRVTMTDEPRDDLPGQSEEAHERRHSRDSAPQGVAA